MKIAILDRCTVTNGDVSLSEIECLGDTRSFDIVPDNKLASAIGDAEAVICNKANISRDIMEQCKALKYIGLFATGYNNIDLDAANEYGISVANVPGYSTSTVAQHTFALLLMLAGSTDRYNASVKAGDWVASKSFSYFPYPITEIAGKTLGVFGFGSIGRAVAAVGAAFGMRVIVCTRTKPNDCAFELVTRDELFSRSDYLTLHAPLTRETEHMVCGETLALMKQSACIINTSRGGAIDEWALADALNSGRIAGAGLDVLTVEPMDGNNPLLRAKNCIITPHIAWAALETRKRLITRVAGNLAAFASGLPINVVNRI